MLFLTIVVWIFCVISIKPLIEFEQNNSNRWLSSFLRISYILGIVAVVGFLSPVWGIFFLPNELWRVPVGVGLILMIALSLIYSIIGVILMILRTVDLLQFLRKSKSYI